MDKTIKLSLSDTNVLKGIGLLLLLCHHLFYQNNGLYDDIHIAGSHYLVQEIGMWSKLCVAIFVFLSGYGLTAKTMKEGGIRDLKHFYWHRFSKLMLNYWFIWLCFVPISIFVFGRTFADAYGSYVIPKLILDFFGLLSCIGINGYNPTWWFYSCIITLYLCYPFLWKLMNGSITTLVCIIIAIYFFPIPQLIALKTYFPSFVAGVIFCKYLNINTLMGGVNYG